MRVGLYLCYEWELVNKCWFRLRSCRLICTFQFQVRWTEQGLGAGVSIYATAQRKRDRKKWLILKEQCTFHTAADDPPPPLPPSHYPISLLLSVPRSPQHPPSLLSPAPAERLTRADEKGSAVKGQCWAATPRKPAPVQSNKAGCPPVTGCLGGKNRMIPACLLIGSLVPLCYLLMIGQSRRCMKGEAPLEI